MTPDETNAIFETAAARLRTIMQVVAPGAGPISPELRIAPFYKM